MTATPLVVHADSYPLPLDVVGEHITVLAPGDVTSHYEVFFQEGPQGSGPIPHSHPWDESFFVIRGAVDFSLEHSADAVAVAGTLVHVPAGATHWFRFRSGGGAMVSITSGRAASALFREIHHEIAPDQPDVAKLIAIAERHGLTASAE